jgi:VWFA-related protein
MSLPGASRAPAEERQEKPEPIPTPLVEKTGISLMLLDVEVTDEQGNPVPGLTKEDFFLKLNGKRREIYSVDDLCGCGRDAALTAAGAGESEETPPSPVAEPVAAAAATYGEEEPVRFVLYLDFSQLRQDGRENALREAERWVRETMQPADEAMIVAYSTTTGLMELSPFTTDRERLLEVLEHAAGDPGLVDPFPVLFFSRVEECERCCSNCRLPVPCRHCCTICTDNARAEYFHGRRALRALKRLLGKMEAVPGRKALLLFHQNGIIYPRMFYPLPESDLGDHVSLLDEVGAGATTSRTAVFPTYTGDNPAMFDPLATQAVNLGANLADFTGGEHNRSVEAVPAMLDRAGRGCACIYRIAIRPPRIDKGKIYRAAIWAADRRVSNSYRVQYLTDLDRWWRKVEHVLEDPDKATDLPLTTTLLPVERTKSGWAASVQVVLDLDSLMLLPDGERSAGTWEIGALLYREEGGRPKEMLGASEVRRDGQDPTGRHIVHERIFESLKPGTYRLGSFLRDSGANLFGGAEAETVLPKPGKAGIVGPLLMSPPRPVMHTGLPLLKKKKGQITRTKKTVSLPIPIPEDPVPARSLLSARTWVCPSKPGKPGTVLRYVAQDGEPLFRFEGDEKKEAGDCFQLNDLIETVRLEPGSYTYHVRWREPTEEEPQGFVEAEITFEVQASGSAPPEEADAG